MQNAFVVSATKEPLMPCHPARARRLLKRGRAAVYRRYPFTIILKDRKSGDVQPVKVKIDPGSKTTGISVVSEKGRVLSAFEVDHRGREVKAALDARRAVRRARRSRNLRYRKPRFDNRVRREGWLPPSIMSRVWNIGTIVNRLRARVPVTSLALELVKFDTQALQNPEISGTEYQEGTLFGYEVREYLLLKWGHACAYCGKSDVPLQKEHIVPRASGGTDRVSNLTLSCRSCNEKKGTSDIRVFLAKDPDRLKRILAQAKSPLKDAAAVNAARYKAQEMLAQTGLPMSIGTGGRTKYNRERQGLPKAHWIDAACVGEDGGHISVGRIKHLNVKATGRGRRQMCLMDRYGFPRTSPKSARTVHGFKTGSIVTASVPTGKKKGCYVGKVAVRSSGFFNITTRNGTVQGISSRCCNIIHRADGYSYH